MRAQATPDVVSDTRPASWSHVNVSIRFMLQHFPEGAKKNSRIEAKRPIVDVPKIVFDPVLHLLQARRLSPQSIDLRPPGNARLDVMAPAIGREHFFILIIMRDSMRTRADKRHIAFEHVKKLRQFVNVWYRFVAARNCSTTRSSSGSFGATRQRHIAGCRLRRFQLDEFSVFALSLHRHRSRSIRNRVEPAAL